MTQISQDYINDRSEVFLTNFLTNSRLSTDIPKHEKRAIWDGSLFLYKNSDRKKEGMERIPVQLKGTVSDFAGKYQMEKSDLLAYQSENGIIFFIVKMEIDENNEIIKNQGKVYYIVLSRNIIDDLLENIGNNASISTTLTELNSNEIMKVCRKFLYIRRTYNNYETIEPSDIDNIEKISIPSFDETETISDILFKDDIIALAKVKGRLKEKIINITGFCSAEIIEKPILINNQIFYDKYVMKKDKKLTKILLDENTIFTLSNLYEDANSRKKIDLTFDYTQSNLLQALKQSEFILALCENKSITFGTQNISFDDFECAEDSLQKLKTHIIGRKVILDELNSFIKNFDLKNLNLKELTTDHYKFISDTFCDNLNLPKDKIKYRLLPVGDIKVLAAFVKNQQGLYSIENAFNHLETLEECQTPSGKKFKVPILLHIPANILIESANLNFEKLNKAISNLKLNTLYMQKFASRFLIDLILCYDKTNNKEFLLSALKLCELFKESDFEMFIINQTQINKRLGIDIEDNLCQISSLLNNPDTCSIFFQCCGHILLENKFKAKEAIKKLSSRELKELKEWPIYKFFTE